MPNEVVHNDNVYMNIMGTSNLAGGAIRDIAAGILEISPKLGSYIKIRSIVIDTNIILQELSYICKKNKPTVLYTEAKMGFVRVFAAPHVMSEVVEHIPDYAESTKVNKGSLEKIWEYYKEMIIVIAPSNHYSESIQKLKDRDPDDAPTAELVELISPDLALSADKDLSSLGYAQSGNWLPYVLKLSDTIDRDVLNVTIISGTSAILIGISESLLPIIKLIKKLTKIIPKKTAAYFGIFVSALLIDSRSRNWLLKKVSNIKQFNNENVSNIKKACIEILMAYSTKQSEWLEAERFLDTYTKAKFIPSNLRGYSIRVLAFSIKPLTITELSNKVQELGYKPRGSNSDQYLKRLLRNDPIFTEDLFGNWSLAYHENT